MISARRTPRDWAESLLALLETYRSVLWSVGAPRGPNRFADIFLLRRQSGAPSLKSVGGMVAVA